MQPFVLMILLSYRLSLPQYNEAEITNVLTSRLRAFA